MNNLWYVYILELSNGSYYTGITNNVHKRFKLHKEGKGSKCVRSFLPFSLIYLEKVQGRSDASKREAKIKKLSRFRKLLLVVDNDLAWEPEWSIYMTEDKKTECGGKKCCQQDDKKKDCDKDDKDCNKDCDKDCDKKDCDKKE